MRLFIVLALLLVACGGEPTVVADTVADGIEVPATSTTLVATPMTTASSIVTNDLSQSDGSPSTPPNSPLIEFEAAWLCSVQRHTYDTAGAVEEALSAALVEADLERAAYDEFKLELSDDPDARRQILDLFVADCS